MKSKLNIFQKIFIGLVVFTIAFTIVYKKIIYPKFSPYKHDTLIINPTTDNHGNTQYVVENNSTTTSYYNGELEKYMKEFIDAKNLYEIFSSRIQYGLALGCINKQLKAKKVDWMEESDYYRKNAINRYALSQKKISQLQQNESTLIENEKIFNFDLIETIENQLLYPINAQDGQICREKIPVQDIYSIFINQYIDQYDTSFMSFYISHHNKTPNHKILKKWEWFTVLEKHYPDYFVTKRQQLREKEKKQQEMLKKKREEEKELREKREKIRLKEVREKYLLELNEYLAYTKDTGVIGNGGAPVFYTAVFANDRDVVELFLRYGVDVNQRWMRETMLTIASKNCKNFDLVELLLNHGANPNLLDGNGFTTTTGLFRYCKKDKNYEKMMNLLKSSRK